MALELILKKAWNLNDIDLLKLEKISKHN